MSQKTYTVAYTVKTYCQGKVEASSAKEAISKVRSFSEDFESHYSETYGDRISVKAWIDKGDR